MCILFSEQEYFFYLEKKDSFFFYLFNFLVECLIGLVMEVQEYFKVEQGDMLGVGILYWDDQGLYFIIVIVVNWQGKQEFWELANIFFGLAGFYLVFIFFIVCWYVW